MKQRFNENKNLHYTMLLGSLVRGIKEKSCREGEINKNPKITMPWCVTHATRLLNKYPVSVNTNQDCINMP